LAKVGADAVAGLSQLARDEMAPRMARRNALRALGTAGGAAGVAPIEDLLASDDRWVRLSAMQACQALMENVDDAESARLAAALEAARDAEVDPLLKRLR